jgi:TonB family protein
MNGARRSWSTEARPTLRLGVAVAASVALHLGAMPGLALRLGGPGDGAATARMLQARIAPERDAPRSGEREDSPAAGAGDGGMPASRSRHGVPAVEEPRYFPAGELDHSPAPLMSVEPKYPAGADGRPGRVVLNLFIDQDGHVDKIVLLSGEHPFDESAIWAFGQARFSPGVRRGEAVKSQMLIEVTYRPDPARTPAPSDAGG